MTIFNKVVATTALGALAFGLLATIVPYDAGALNAPRCVLNTIVQPFNNGGTTLSWKVYDAHTVTMSSIGTVSDADSVVVYPTSSTVYTLTATGNGGSVICTATAQATSSYSFNNGNFNNATNSETCSLKVSPDYVVPGGTAVLSWNVGSASRVWLDHNLGTVSNTGTKVVPYSAQPETYTLTAQNSNGSQRNCSAVVRPAIGGVPTFTGGVNIPGAFVVQTPGVVLPYTQPTTVHATAQHPSVTATYSQPTVQYVSIAQVPYTGPNDVAYVLTLIAIALGAFGLIATQRGTFRSAFLSFSPTDNEDHEVAREEATA